MIFFFKSIKFLTTASRKQKAKINKKAQKGMVNL